MSENNQNFGIVVKVILGVVVLCGIYFAGKALMEGTLIPGQSSQVIEDNGAQ